MMTRELTQHAPHIRDGFSLERASHLMIVALIPCMVMAIINTGFQANVELAMSAVDKPLDTLPIISGPRWFMARSTFYRYLWSPY